jgi:hypothetical protein
VVARFTAKPTISYVTISITILSLQAVLKTYFNFHAVLQPPLTDARQVRKKTEGSSDDLIQFSLAEFADDQLEPPATYRLGEIYFADIADSEIKIYSQC